MLPRAPRRTGRSRSRRPALLALLALVLTLLPLPVGAQGLAPTYWGYRAPMPVQATHAGDLDADGQLEIVIGTYAGQVICLRSDGSLAWQTTVSPTAITALTSVDYAGRGQRHVLAAAGQRLYDLDNTGRLVAVRNLSRPLAFLMAADLAGKRRQEVLGHGSHESLLRLAPGGGVVTVYESKQRRASLQVTAVRTIDIEGDRRLEIAVVSTAAEPRGVSSGHVLSVFAADGTLRWESYLDARPVALELVALDGTGRAQLAVASENGNIRLFTAEGRLVWSTLLGGRCTGLAGGEFGPNRQPGLLVALERELTMLAPNGQESWRYGLSGPVRRALAADLTGEGSDQIAAITTSLDADERVLGASLVTLGDQGQLTAQYRLGAVPSHIEALDINGDGREELLAVTGHDVQLLAYPGRVRRREQWRASCEGPVRAMAAHPLGLIVADQSRTFSLIGPDGSERWPRHRLAGEVSEVAVGDLDGEGQPEVVVAYNGFSPRGEPITSGVNVYDGDGQPAWQLPLDVWVPAVATGDLDGDGRAEVLVGSSDHLVRAVDGDGQVRWSQSVGGRVASLLAADLGGDGGGDVIAGTDAGQVTVFSASGATRWQATLDGPVRHLRAARLAAGATSLVAASDHQVRALGGDGSTLWRREIGLPVRGLVTSDLDHDGLHEVVVGCGGEVTAYRANGQLLWRYRLGGDLTALAACDTDRDGMGEVFAGNDLGDLVVLSHEGRWLEHQVFRPAITHLAATQFGAAGRVQVAVATQRGELSLLQARTDSLPLVANAGVTREGSGYVYAATALDPEGDVVDLTLSVIDPLAGRWLTDERRRIVGQGVQYWVRPSFGSWPLARLAQYRLQCESNGVEFIVGPLPGPAIEGIPRAALVAILGALLAGGVVYWHWEQSPPRQARRLLRLLRPQLAETLVTLRRFLERSPATHACLMPLAQQARQAGSDAVAALAEGFYLLGTQPESALAILRGVVGRHLGWQLAEVQLAIVEDLEALLQANSIGRLTVLRGHLDRLEATLLQTERPLREWVRPVASLRRVRAVLRDGERVAHADDKLLYLEEARGILEDAAAQAPPLPPVPEGPVIEAILRSWLAVVTNAAEEVRGRAELEIALKTRRIVGGQEAVLAVTVQNVGRSPASQVTIELTEDPAFVALQASATVPFLPAGASRDLEFVIRPLVKDRFRVELVARYDDPQALGKSQTLGDVVDILHPSAEFIPIPNPYTPGRPLRPDSPVFFGRDDIFAFIAENARGLRQRNILMLIGQRRTGKTSILLQLPLRLGDAYLPVYLDCQSLGITPGMSAFFFDLASTIADAARERGLTVALPPEEAWREHPTRTFERQFLPAIRPGLGGRTLLLVFDEFEDLEDRVAAGRLDATIFPYLRHLLQHSEDTAFIFVGTHRLEEMTADYWSVLFNTALYRHVGYLDEEAAIRLITEPVRPYNLLYDDLALSKILRVTAGHPYFLQLICYSLVNMHNRNRRSYVTVHETNQAIDEILTLGEAHFAFLWENSSAEERVILVALSRLLSAAQPVSAGEVTSLLADRGLPLDPREVSAALRSLVTREILRQLPGDPARYEFRVGLIRLWVDRCKSLSQVIEEIT